MHKKLYINIARNNGKSLLDCVKYINLIASGYNLVVQNPRVKTLVPYKVLKYLKGENQDD